MEVELSKGTRTDIAISLSSPQKCQLDVRFDLNENSKSGKLIPSNEYGNPDDCSNSRCSSCSAQVSEWHRQFASASNRPALYAMRLIQNHWDTNNEACPRFKHMCVGPNSLQYGLKVHADALEV